MRTAIFTGTLVSIACVLLLAHPSPAEASGEIIESKCTEDESREKDKTCAHTFLEKIKQPSANCSIELMRYRECFKNFTLGQCFGDYIKSNPPMKVPMMRMAGIKSKIHNFARMICGITEPHPINTTGLPDKVKHLLKCKSEFFDKAKDCAKTFHDKFMGNRNSSNLCRAFLEAKMCNGRLMKEHCDFKMSPPRDHFNPFCPHMKDPPYPHGGAEKTCTSAIFLFVGLPFYLFF